MSWDTPRVHGVQRGKLRRAGVCQGGNDDVCVVFKASLTVRHERVAGDNGGSNIAMGGQEVGDTSIARVRVAASTNTRGLNGPINACIAIRLPPFSSRFSSTSDEVFTIESRVGGLLPGGASKILIIKLNGSSVAPSTLNPGATGSVFSAHRVAGSLTRRIKLPSLQPMSSTSPKILNRANVRDTRVVHKVVGRASPSTMVAISTLSTHDVGELNYAIRVAGANVIPNSKINGRHTRVDQGALKIPMVTVKIPAIMSTTTLICSVAKGRGVPRPRHRETRGVVIAPHRVSIVVDHTSHLLTLTVGSTLRPSVSVGALLSLMWRQGGTRVVLRESCTRLYSVTMSSWTFYCAPCATTACNM